MTTWCSIFHPSANRDAVLAAAQAWLNTAGYTAYDPFTGIPGASFAHAVKAFVAPAAQGTAGPWVRLIFEAAPAERDALLAALPGAVLLDAADPRLPASAPTSTVAGVQVGGLPANAQAYADRIDPAKADALAGKLLGAIGARFGMNDATADQARALLAQGGSALDLANGAGATLAAHAAALGLPPGWHTPDFVTLRDAYALARRLQRLPNARLYPGDAEARAAVPDALAYAPLFGGKNA